MEETSSGDDTPVMECLKMKLGTFFSESRAQKLEDAVRVVTKILTRSSILLKTWYLQQSDAPEISDELLEMCFSVVQGKVRTVRTHRCDDGEMRYSAKSEGKVVLFNALKTVYEKHLKPHCDPHYLTNDLSLSRILNESASQLKVNFKTNVVHNFDKYVRCLVYEELLDGSRKGAALKAHKRDLAKVTDHLLYNSECPAEYAEWADNSRLRIPSFPTSSSRDAHLERHPWLYLRCMVNIVTHLEARRSAFDIKGKSLPSPFVLCRSAVPRSIRLVTGGLVQLLMEPCDVEKFVKFYRDKTGNEIVMTSKSDLCSDFATVHKREPASKTEDALYQTWKWRYLLNFDTKKGARVLQHKRRDGTWRFFNAAFTDGVSIAFCVTPENQVMDMSAKFQRRRQSKAAAKKNKTVPEFKSVADIDISRQKVIAADPGKGNLLTLTDGTRKVAFSSRERDHVVSAPSMRYTQAQLTLKITDADGTTVAAVQEQMLDSNSRSCDLPTFLKYAAVRMKHEALLESCYARRVFRNHRYRSYSRRKGWLDQSIDYILEVFSQPCAKKPHGWMQQKATDDPVYRQIIEEARLDKNKQLVIAYGNWGRSPNLRGNKPTPGIGLRRAINRRIKTFTQCEAYTSQTCPCCHHRSIENVELLESHRRVHEKHSLLECTHDACSCRYFQRDVLASINILYKAHHTLIHHTAPAAFKCD